MFVNSLVELGDGGMAEHLRGSAMARGYLGLAVVFVWHGARSGGLISVFQEFSAGIGKTFIFCGGRWALGYHSMRFGHLIFLNFLRS